ncbi:MAG: hypothetical protein A2014_00410 [Spirochaetes bacterium GWF1_49_6]|nr:MAG: hypothetical protein A2014_00410 [Spirochaetes bacterium GWF1_49_6]
MVSPYGKIKWLDMTEAERLAMIAFIKYPKLYLVFEEWGDLDDYPDMRELYEDCLCEVYHITEREEHREYMQTCDKEREELIETGRWEEIRKFYEDEAPEEIQTNMHYAVNYLTKTYGIQEWNVEQIVCGNW